MSGAPRSPPSGGGFVPQSGQRAAAYLQKHAQQVPTEGRPGFDYGFGGDPNGNASATITAHRTAARTGTTFDMADLITHGHATKLPNVTLPMDHPAVAVIQLNEMTMPGDVLGNSPRHPPVTAPVEERLAQIIRERSLDLVNLMDDFLKRPATSKMPVRNRSFLDVSTFRRAICYAMGDQWTRLAMTTTEFNDLVKQYMREDNTFYDKDKGQDAQGYTKAEPLVLWQPFAYSVMKLADGDKYAIKLRGAMDAEKEALYKKSVADANKAEQEYAELSGWDIGSSSIGTKTSNTAFALARNNAARMEKQKEDLKPIGKRGARVGEVNAAKKLICNRLLEKNATVRAALKDIDEDGSGILSRQEVKKMLTDFNLMKYYDFYTGQVRARGRHCTFPCARDSSAAQSPLSPRCRTLPLCS